MRFRDFGKSGLRVSEIGLGCNRIGESFQSDEEWIRVIHQALELGINFLDTAEQYNNGRSEELIGRAVGKRDDVHIATKVSPRTREPGPPVYTVESVTRAVDASLRRLRRECIDVYQTHGGSLEQLIDSEITEAFARLKEQGKIRVAAFAVFDAPCALHFMRNGVAGAFQLTYNILDRSHALPVIEDAGRHGAGIISRMPYHRGILTGKFRPNQEPDPGHRALLQGARLQGEITRAEALRPLEPRPGGLPALALQYALAEPRLSTVIAGARSVEQVRQNVDAAQAPPLTPDEQAFISRLQQSWEHEKTRP